MDGLLIATGMMALVLAIPAILRPETLVRESRSNRERRLKELEEGAPERHFEERRELEAYEPRFDLSNRTIRILGFGSFGLGLVSLIQGVS